MSSKTFTRWTEEERRAHRRKQNAAYQARKVEHLTPRQKQIKEEEHRKRQETKQAMEQGEWVATATVATVKVSIKVEKKVVAKNGFAALESDEEPETDKKEKEVKETAWGKQKIDWAADSDDE